MARPFGRKTWLVAGAGALALVVAVLARAGLVGGVSSQEIPTATVQRGQFRISHFESGEIRASRGEQVTAPRVRGNLKIVHLWPEGEHVEVGDLILQFDRADLAKEVKDEAGELEQAQADLTKALAKQDQQMHELEAQIEQRKAAVGLARINLQKAEYASPIEREQRDIYLGKAERALAEAQEKLGARHIIQRVERANLELRITHRQRRYDKAGSDYERLSVFATRPGIVVYEKIRKRGTDRRGKVTEGDVVWGGTSLLSLPELSEMQAFSQVGEMDVHKVAVGMSALVRLEAYPGPVFHGKVSNIAPMAIEDEHAPNVHIFEMTVDLDVQDERLYPGMSTSVEVIIESLDDVLFIPLAVVRERDGGRYVQRLSGRKLVEVEVQLGKDNGIDVVVVSGLDEGDTVAIPTPPAL